YALDRLAVDLDPVRKAKLLRDLQRGLDAQLLLAALAHLHGVTGADLEGRNVHLLPVDQDRAMIDQLARLGPGHREPHAINHVVEPRLEELQEYLAGRALAAVGLLVVVGELLFKDAVHATKLLLLAQLRPVDGDSRPAAPGLESRGALELALAVQRAHGALEKQVGAFAARQLAGWSNISCHGSLRLKPYVSSADGTRCAGSASRRRCSECRIPAH